MLFLGSRHLWINPGLYGRLERSRSTAPRSPLTRENTSKWRRFWALPREERILVLRAALCLTLVVAGLRLLGFRRCHGLIQNFSLRRRKTALGLPESPEGMERILRAARLAERNAPFESNCLERSLALWWVLRLSGLRTDLHMGGRKSGGRFEAHAWVEWDGQVLNDEASVHKHYARFDAPVAVAEDDSG